MPLDRESYRSAGQRSSVTRYSPITPGTGTGGVRGNDHFRNVDTPRGCRDCGDQVDVPGGTCAPCVSAWRWCATHQDPQLRDELDAAVGTLLVPWQHAAIYLHPHELLAMQRREEAVVLAAPGPHGSWLRRRYTPALAQLLDTPDVRIGMARAVRDLIDNQKGTTE